MLDLSLSTLPLQYIPKNIKEPRQQRWQHTKKRRTQSPQNTSRTSRSKGRDEQVRLVNNHKGNGISSDALITEISGILPSNKTHPSSQPPCQCPEASFGQRWEGLSLEREELRAPPQRRCRRETWDQLHRIPKHLPASQTEGQTAV